VAEVFIYGRNGNGGHNVGVAVDGTRVLIESRGEEHDKEVERLARSIAEKHEANVVSDGERRAHKVTVSRLSESLERANERARMARSALESALNGRRRFFGPVLCVAGPDGWSGEVWLLDPQKRESGFGLVFDSLAHLREMHPELWIVRPEVDGILLDVCPIPRTDEARDA
jgi:hypothetical protein